MFYKMPIETLAASLGNHKRLTTHGPSPRNRCSQSARRFSPATFLHSDVKRGAFRARKNDADGCLAEH